MLGIDLGQNAAMSAAAGYWPATGTLEALAVFPEVPGLAERGLQDGVGRRYQDVARRGELIDGGEDVRRFRAACLAGKVRPVRSCCSGRP